MAFHGELRSNHTHASTTDADALLARKGSPAAFLVQGILQNLDVYLSACQMGITMASLSILTAGVPPMTVPS